MTTAPTDSDFTLTADAVGIRSSALFGSCCFTCCHWIGKRRKDTAYCKRLNLSGKDAPCGDDVCILWEKRINARMPNVRISDGANVDKPL